MSDAAPRRMIGYVRVSTEQQADRGNSIEAQQTKIAQYAAAFGIELIAIEIDAGVSAKSLGRPALQRALAHLDAGTADGILVAKLDRLTRSVRDLCDLVDERFKDGTWHLMSVGENVDTRSAAGRMVLNIIATVAQWEREAAAERTAAVMEHMKSTGRFTGGFPPYGWRLDEEGGLVVDEDEARVVARAKELRGQGHALRAIACALGTNTRNGKPFAASQIARML
jgi:site-specific DNA recombinase